MSIVTFYSYKGGVGRSMALANIALLLARAGRKVLMVDWDLEAPGLEKYFSTYEIQPRRPGLLRMFMDATTGKTVDYRKYASEVQAKTPEPLLLLDSGRELDPEYSHNLESFDWEEFFAEHDGGAFVERLRDRWRKDFDFVFIDSRTGLSDSGGICTIQLPDIIVAMFTANQQSLYGVRDVMHLAQAARQDLAYDRSAISIIPLASRWSDSEFREAQQWTERIAEAVAPLVRDWLPRGIKAQDAVQALRVPHHPYFSFGERLAVAEGGSTDPASMAAAYQRVADFIASDCSDLKGLLGSRATVQLEALSPKPKAVTKEDYEYDLFVSHHNSISSWVLELVDQLKVELTPLLNREVRIFADVREVKTSELWDHQIADALLRSRVLMPVITTHFAQSEWLQFEYRAFIGRKNAPVLPLLFRGAPPAEMALENSVDMRAVAFEQKHDSRWYTKVQEVTLRLIPLIKSAPKYDPSWGEQLPNPPRTSGARLAKGRAPMKKLAPVKRAPVKRRAPVERRVAAKTKR